MRKNKWNDLKKKNDPLTPEKYAQYPLSQERPFQNPMHSPPPKKNTKTILP